MLTLASKRENTVKHSEEHHTKGPHVYVLAIILMLSDKFRCHVRRGSAKDLVLLVSALGIVGEACKAKVNNLDHSCFFFNQDVVKLNVSMCYPLFVKILKSFSYLLKKPSTCRLLNYSVGALSLHIMVHTYAIYKISHYANLLLSFYQVVHFDTVWMVYFSKGYYLTLYCFAFHLVI